MSIEIPESALIRLSHHATFDVPHIQVHDVLHDVPVGHGIMEICRADGTMVGLRLAKTCDPAVLANARQGNYFKAKDGIEKWCHRLTFHEAAS